MQKISYEHNYRRDGTNLKNRQAKYEFGFRGKATLYWYTQIRQEAAAGGRIS
jgi:hypothetical protein